MKKFISALSSLVIAATAMGGALALNANAEVNTKVDKTIIDIRSGSSNALNFTAAEVAAGVTIPVQVYIPQSAGLNAFSGMFCINQDATMGEGTAVNPATGKEEKNQYLNGNYGIKMSQAKFSEPNALYSGVWDNNNMFAGVPGSYALIYDDTWTMLYTSAPSVQYADGSKNVDSYSAWIAQGGDPEDEDYDFEDAGYVPVTTWTKDEAWAYDNSVIEFTLTLPTDLAEGTYDLDLFKKEYVTVQSIWAAEGEKLYTNTTGFDGADDAGETVHNEWESIPLSIVVGEGGDVTTTATSKTDGGETTTTATSKTEDSGSQTEVEEGTIVYDFIPGNDLAYTLKGNNNVVNVAEGGEYTFSWIVNNDQGTAGLEYSFDFSQVTYKKAKAGKAYAVSPTLNDEAATDTGRFDYVLATTEDMFAKDGAKILTFTIDVPNEEGDYTVGLWTKDANNITVPLDQYADPWKTIFHGITFHVGEGGGDQTTVSTDGTSGSDSETTTTVTTTTETDDTTKAPIGDVVWGDTNCDGKVTISDVVLLNKYISGNTKAVSEQGQANADCEYDGVLDSKDATKIKKYLALLIPYTDLGKQ